MTAVGATVEAKVASTKGRRSHPRQRGGTPGGSGRSKGGKHFSCLICSSHLVQRLLIPLAQPRKEDGDDMEVESNSSTTALMSKASSSLEHLASVSNSENNDDLAAVAEAAAAAAERAAATAATASQPSMLGTSGCAWRSSTKIEALLQELTNLHRSDPSIKSIVFSQWTSMLDIVEEPLRQCRIRFVRLDGSMVQAHRVAAIRTFAQDPSVTVFLISMKAGGLGLNLVSASHVFLLDPWWNPATEQQAIDRVHRMGQVRPVVVTRFIIRGTIEERILELQEKKRRLAQGALMVHSKELRQIRLDELRLLFRD